MSNYTLYLVLLAIVGLALTINQSRRNQKRDSDPAAQEKDAQKKQAFTDMLEDGEQLLGFSAALIGKDQNAYCAVTNRRVLMDMSGQVAELAHFQILNVKYYNFRSQKTKPGLDVWYFVITDSQKTKYKIYQTSDNFKTLVTAMADAGWT